MKKTAPSYETQELRDFAGVLRGRRTIELFLQTPVPEHLLNEAIDAATWAPNHHVTEPWHFYMLGEKTIAASIELLRTIVTETKSAELADFKATSATAIPGWLLVTCKKSEDELLEQEDYASCCCAIQNLTLYLSEAGIATKWTTGLITRDQRFFDLLEINADKEFVVGLIWYGYPKVLPTQSRKDVAEITTEKP